MKKTLILTALLVIASVFVVANVYGDMIIYDNVNGKWVQPISLYYGDAWKIDHVTIDVDPNHTHTVIGEKCSKFTVIEDIGWYQIGSQYNGGKTGPLDMTGYTSLELKAAANPATTITFGMGSGDPLKDSCEQSVELALNDTGWTTHTIDLIAENMSGITNMVWFSAGSAIRDDEIYVRKALYKGGAKGEVTVTISGATGVSIIEGSIDLGIVDPGTSKAGGPITIKNIGTVNEDFWLAVSEPAGWKVITSEDPGHNEFKMYGAFASALAAITWNETNHVLSTESEISTTTRFAGDVTGEGVVPDATRDLYINFFAPKTTSVSNQKIFIVVGCSATP